MRCLLFVPTQNFKLTNIHNGFTLIELLTVISLIAIIATVAVNSYDGVQDAARNDVAQFEMAEIRKALIQLRKDSGTRSLPAQGSYDCTDEINGGVNNVPNSLFAFPDEAGTTNPQIIAWCQHPANFWMLFTNPFDITTNPELVWNPDTKRGWNGPYLQRKDGFLSLDGNTVNLADIEQLVWGIADPYVVEQQSTGVNWSLQTASAVLDDAGSPYLLLVDITNTPPVYEPRLISAGGDGVFEDNNTNHCTAPLDADGLALDMVLCLLN